MAKDSLALDMSADPAEFAEACEEFAARRVISRLEADQLSGYARKHSWWISGVAQMDVANDAHRSILESMRDGTTFEEWKKKAGAAIEKEWGRKDSSRLLLIYRNATTSAYNAGRLEQMEQPHVTAVRPYKMLDVVNDERTSHICRKFISPEVVLPWDDPWWLTHSPPFHHMCRTGIRSLRKSVAQRYGISAEPPVVNIDAGWGLHPKYSQPVTPSARKIQPDPELHYEAMVKASKDLQRKAVEVPKKFVAPPPKRTIDNLPEDELPFGDAFPGTAASESLTPKQIVEGQVAFFNETKAQLADLSADELKAFRRYTADGYGAIRDAARLDEAAFKAKYPIASYAAQKKLGESIENVIARSRGIEGRAEAKIRELYRGVNLLSRSDLERLMNDSLVEFDAITSTSWKSENAASFCVGEGEYSVFYRIKPAKNSNSVSCEPASDVKSEHEVMFGRGTKFKVTKVTRDVANRNSVIVYLDELD